MFNVSQQTSLDFIFALFQDNIKNIINLHVVLLFH